MLLFSHVGSLCMHIAGMCPNADSNWMAHQARNLFVCLSEQGESRPTDLVQLWSRNCPQNRSRPLVNGLEQPHSLLMLT